MPRMRAWGVVAVAALLAGALLGCTPRDVAESSCLDGSRPIVSPPMSTSGRWPSSSLFLADGTAVDARGANVSQVALDANGYSLAWKFHAKVGSRRDLCVVGGRMGTTFDPEMTTWDTWHRVYAVVTETPDFTLVGTSFWNEGDGIVFTPGATDWEVIGVAAEGPPGSAGAYIHDDCIENDQMYGGRIVDSKFDGCNNFLSANAGSEASVIDGSANTLEVTGTLVRLQAYYESYNPAKYGHNRHGGFFKFGRGPGKNGTPPQLRISDSVFRADTRGVYGGSDNGFMGIPDGTECDNVTLIGAETWADFEVESWTSQCTNLTFGTVADWDAAVAEWDATHPDM